MTKRRTPAAAACSFPVVRHAPGLEETQGLPNGGMQFFAPGSVPKQRTYRDENDGWTTIRRKRGAGVKKRRTA